MTCRVEFLEVLLVGGLPYFGRRAMNTHSLVSRLQHKLTFLQRPLSFFIDKCQLAAGVHVATQDIGQRVTTKITRQVKLHDCSRTGLPPQAKFSFR